MHEVVASLLDADAGRVAKELAALPPDITLAEVRLDGLWPGPPEPELATDQLIALRDATDRRLLATLRPRREGGRYDGPEDVRLGLLVAARRAGFDLVDLELPDGPAGPFLHAMGEQLGAGANDGGPAFTLSRHLPDSPGCRDDSLLPLQALQDGGGAYDKLAFPSGSFLDDVRALEAARLHALRGGRPSVSTLGSPRGAELRAILAVAGNHATYGHAPGLPPAVAGQPGIADVAAFWKRWSLSDEDLGGPGRAPRDWLAVLGDPVEGSLSPRLHNAAFRAAGRRERFVAFTVPPSPAALRLVLTAAPRIGLVGASVTYPHKADAARMAKCDAVAAAVGAANQVRFPATGAEATNTDATALRDLLRPHVDAGTRVLVLGAGGAARATLWAARELGAKPRFASREAARSAQAATLGERIAWEDLPQARADVWVQATTLGLRPGEPNPAVPHGARVAVEMNYKGGPTAFAAEAAAQKAKLIDGRAVVLEQALHAQRFWFGAPPPRAAMEAALVARP